MASNPEFTVQNIVASADLVSSVLNLNITTIGFGLENIKYKPEQFQGLAYRINSPKIVVPLFDSGKLAIA